MTVKTQDAEEMERALFISITFLLLAFMSVIVWKVICINTVLFNIQRDQMWKNSEENLCEDLCEF